MIRIDSETKKILKRITVEMNKLQESFNERARTISEQLEQAEKMISPIDAFEPITHKWCKNCGHEVMGLIDGEWQHSNPDYNTMTDAGVMMYKANKECDCGCKKPDPSSSPTKVPLPRQIRSVRGD